MVELLQMFLFLFKSKYRRKWSWFSPFLCSVLIVLLFCHIVVSKCSVSNCVNGVCNNDTCVCFEGWQGPECQYCGGKIKLTSLSGFITDGPGNYSVSIQCTWLISPEKIGADPPPIRIRLEGFATECGWDHLYVYDGNSVRAEKMLAVYSGVFNDGESSWTRQVVARSGQVLVHFFSDDAYAMEGFNLTYAAYSCPSDSHYTNCSNHGVCDSMTGECKCDAGWIGAACDEVLCPDDCNSAYNFGNCTATGCVCNNRRGISCALASSLAGWEVKWGEKGGRGVRPKNPPMRAGHELLYTAGGVLSVGGEGFGEGKLISRYKIDENVWEDVEIYGESPMPRYLHSAILYKDEIIVYGGRLLDGDNARGGLAGLEGRAGEVTNELWRIKLEGNAAFARNATPTTCGHRAPPMGHCGGLQVSGHRAVLVHIGATRKPVMLSFFGHSPHYGYLHVVQEYYIEEGQWGVVGSGMGGRGGFAHSAVWDAHSRRVYLHAGLLADSEAAQSPSSMLHEYEPESRQWRQLPAAPCARYLHSAALVSPGVMLVYGGNTHNDSAIAAVASEAACRCYSDTAYLYHVRCKSWIPLESPGTARAAHASVLLPSRTSPKVLIHGGFDGRLRSDGLVLSTGARCSAHTTEYSCVTAAASTARACVWTQEQRCVPLEEIGWEESHQSEVRACVSEPVLDERRCLPGATCAACVAASCVWCGACYASLNYCVRANRHHVATEMNQCTGEHGELWSHCAKYHSCTACHAHRAKHTRPNEDPGPRLCYWDYDTVKCRPANNTEDIRSVPPSSGCSAPCSTYQSCANCTAEECIWCASADKCVDKNAYGATFPLGGCRAWSTASGSASCSTTGGCSVHQSCAACRQEPACGWCDDGAGSGSGVCLPGSSEKPHAGVCPKHQWHFTSCPACQCNGHSLCVEGEGEGGGGGGGGGGRCIQPCGGRAVGEHCELCAPSHWGSALNARHCQPCECNEHATSCAVDTGRCFCSTKGLSGDRCDKCDMANHYHGDAINKGACYYDLAVDYQFTFNLSKKEDRHLSAINFRNSPVKADVDADFSITCSSHARMNLTVRTKNEPTERVLFAHLNCTNFRTKFAKSEHAFGVEDNVTLTTFFVYVYDFKPPLWIQISFSQYPKLNLQQFFITFSSCFLLLLLLAAALWKIKQKYDMYRRRQRLFVEMEQMASRPFSQVCVELERGGGVVGVPAPVALEPCCGGRAAVLSLLVRLPCGGAGVAPAPGGLAVASALVSLGHRQPTGKPPTRQITTPSCK